MQDGVDEVLYEGQRTGLTSMVSEDGFGHPQSNKTASSIPWSWALADVECHRAVLTRSNRLLHYVLLPCAHISEE